MMEHGMRADQVAQIRGFADQHLRYPGDPENPSNRRISIIIQYRDDVPPPADEAAAQPAVEPEPPKKSGH